MGLLLFVNKHEIDVHIALNAGDGAGFGVLPEVDAVGEVHLVLVLGQPEGVFRQLLQVQQVPGHMGIEVDHGLMAVLLDDLAEGFGAFRQGLPVHGAGAGVTADPLPVVDHGQVQAFALEEIQAPSGLLGGLLRGDGLGVEVDAHVEACGLGAGQIFPGAVVGLDPAHAVAPVADADEGKVEACGADLLPIDLALVLADVDATSGGAGGAGDIAVHGGKIRGGVGIVGQGGGTADGAGTAQDAIYNVYRRKYDGGDQQGEGGHGLALFALLPGPAAFFSLVHGDLLSMIGSSIPQKPEFAKYQRKNSQLPLYLGRKLCIMNLLT